MFGMLRPITQLRNFFVKRAGSDVTLSHRDPKNQDRSVPPKKKHEDGKDPAGQQQPDETTVHSIDVLA